MYQELKSMNKFVASAQKKQREEKQKQKKRDKQKLNELLVAAEERKKQNVEIMTKKQKVFYSFYMIKKPVAIACSLIFFIFVGNFLFSNVELGYTRVYDKVTVDSNEFDLVKRYICQVVEKTDHQLDKEWAKNVTENNIDIFSDILSMIESGCYDISSVKFRPSSGKYRVLCRLDSGGMIMFIVGQENDGFKLMAVDVLG